MQSSKEINLLIRKTASSLGLTTLPRHEDILRYIPKPSTASRLLTVKPAKSASGVTVIAVMPKPNQCPHGRCIYCPGGVERNTPLSYTGTEPVTMVAQESGYDAYTQVSSKLDQLQMRGHQTAKCELVFVGGTFPFFSFEYQREFAKSCYDALNGFKSANLQESIHANESADNRCVGLTIETKPDYCKESHVDMMLELGATRVEIGVQSLQDKVFNLVKRGHTLADVYNSFRIAREAGLKIVAHMMPGLPGSTPENDIRDFHSLFEDEGLRPDMLKIYPTLVLEGTGLYRMYAEKRYHPYSDEELTSVLVEAKKMVPPWVRIMRIQREIESEDIVAGPQAGNLRQLVIQKLKSQGFTCRCIRCREAGLQKKYPSEDEVILRRTDYVASHGREVFLSFETRDGSTILGFLRLRHNSDNSHRTELQDAAVVRELHVYGQAIGLGTHSIESLQHRGYGTKLMLEAQRIAAQDFGVSKIAVISAVGTREYYRRLGYEQDGPFISKRVEIA